VLADTYGSDEAFRWLNRWRTFHMACSELFGFNGGNEWWVGHYLFEKPDAKMM
jgi:cyclopropane-fatty-acyl-phospholipid synthase